MLAPTVPVLGLPVSGMASLYLAAWVTPQAGRRVLTTVGGVRLAVAGCRRVGARRVRATNLAIATFGLALNVLGVGAILLAIHLPSTRLVVPLDSPDAG